MTQHLHITVRELVEHVLRSGDLEMGFSGTARAVAGIRAHQKIQLSRPDGYQREVQVSYKVQTEPAVVEVSGRIDGVFMHPEEITLEEIKTTTRDLKDVKATENERHWAQIKIYAYLYAKINSIENLKIQLTYCHLPSGDLLEKKRSVDIDALEQFFTDLMDRYLEHVAFLREWRDIRDLSIRELQFPHPVYRPGQRELAVQVYRTIDNQDQLLAQAPTGVGKTVATLFPAVKAVAEKKVERIFYLTARSTGKAVAEETLAKLRQKGLRLKSVTLTAKDKVCFKPDAACTGDDCEFAQGYYNRVDEALRESIQKDNLNSEAIAAGAWRHKICPFEFSLDLALWADCIIADYNYAFDPYAYLKRFFLVPDNEALFLIDEAHNLVDRSREMFSSELGLREMRYAEKEIKKELNELCQCLGEVSTWLYDYSESNEMHKKYISTNTLPHDLLPLLQLFVFMSDGWLSTHKKHALREVVLDMYFKVNRFLKVAELFDDTYAACYESNDGDLKIKLFCIDPSQRLRKVLDNCRAAVFFSATLTPMAYYHKLFGCSASAKILVQPSPFPRENLCMLIDSSISTYYHDRESTSEALAETIGLFAGQKTGNYLIFFPSYEYMTMVGDIFSIKYPQLKVMMQKPTMTEVDRKSFLKYFKHKNHETLVGFVVLGGVFGEGIDLLGDRLTGAVVVSVGQPPLTPEREVMQAYFNEHFRAGFEFAYVFPGFNRVLQASGRVIRSETDRGSVLLIDKRYSRKRYTSLFPSDWRPVYVRDSVHMREMLSRFWEV
jgi:DNA excision repair protein ERCC-2